MSRATDRREGRGWPGFLFGGRVRTSTLALLIAFFATWWLFETYQPAPAPPEQVPASEVVPPGFIPDPAYTWAPRTAVQTRPPTPTTTTPITTTPTTTTTTTTETEAPTTEGEPSTSPEVSSGVPPTPGPSTPVQSAPALSTPVDPRSSETPVATPPASGTATSATPAPPKR